MMVSSPEEGNHRDSPRCRCPRLVQATGTRLSDAHQPGPEAQNRHVDWSQHQIVIPGANAKDAENRRIPFDPQGRLAPILKRRAALGPYAFVFGSPDGEFQDSFKTAWEFLLLVATGTTRSARNPALESSARSCSRLTSTGTICVTKAPAAS